MATIIVENVPDDVIKLYGTKVNFDYNLFKKDDFDTDFRELSENELSDELLISIEKAKKTPKSKLINLSKEYANY